MFRISNKMTPQTRNRVGKACALAAAALMLPVVAHAQTTASTSTSIDAAKKRVYSVPDRGPGILLLTTAIGTVLLVGAILRSRAKT